MHCMHPHSNSGRVLMPNKRRPRNVRWGEPPRHGRGRGGWWVGSLGGPGMPISRRRGRAGMHQDEPNVSGGDVPTPFPSAPRQKKKHAILKGEKQPSLPRGLIHRIRKRRSKTNTNVRMMMILLPHAASLSSKNALLHKGTRLPATETGTCPLC